MYTLIDFQICHLNSNFVYIYIHFNNNPKYMHFPFSIFAFKNFVLLSKSTNSQAIRSCISINYNLDLQHIVLFSVLYIFIWLRYEYILFVRIIDVYFI